MTWENTTDRIKRLAQAGAMIDAELERLLRKEDRERQQPRRFKYANGVGVYEPRENRYRYTNFQGVQANTLSRLGLSGFEWLDGEPPAARVAHLN